MATSDRCTFKGGNVYNEKFLKQDYFTLPLTVIISD